MTEGAKDMITFFVQSTEEPIETKDNIIGCEVNNETFVCADCKVIRLGTICNFTRRTIKRGAKYATKKAR